MALLSIRDYLHKMQTAVQLIDEDELNEMATDPDEKHVLEASFSELDKFKDAMKQQICSGELPARISCTLHCI